MREPQIGLERACPASWAGATDPTDTSTAVTQTARTPATPAGTTTATAQSGSR
ncbi:MAG: hypothetical protein ACRDTF_05410 [Pseudonocardiaceae bacterium]